MNVIYKSTLRGGTTKQSPPELGQISISMRLPRKLRLLAMTSQKGFTLIELMVTIGIFGILIGISTISLSNIQRTSSLSSEVNRLIPDLKEQQVKAMSGDTENSGVVSDYGIHFDSASYTLFRSTYVAGNADNFVISLSPNITVNTSLTGGEMVFQKGSGEVAAGASTVVFTDTTTGRTQTVTINKLGVVTGVD